MFQVKEHILRVLGQRAPPLELVYGLGFRVGVSGSKVLGIGFVSKLAD